MWCRRLQKMTFAMRERTPRTATLGASTFTLLSGFTFLPLSRPSLSLLTHMIAFLGQLTSSVLIVESIVQNVTPSIVVVHPELLWLDVGMLLPKLRIGAIHSNCSSLSVLCKIAHHSVLCKIAHHSVLCMIVQLGVDLTTNQYKSVFLQVYVKYRNAFLLTDSELLRHCFVSCVQLHNPLVGVVGVVVRAFGQRLQLGLPLY
jgi:hypothetical protein